ncbi:MAG TPA: thioredoxin family protein [bacterium]|nr:thioredoxin family protein [bacterium]
MTLLKPADAAAVRRRFQDGLRDDVAIEFFTSSSSGLAVPGWECELCPMTRQLLEELVALDPRLKLEVRSAAAEPTGGGALPVERIPAVLLGRNGRSGTSSGIRFYGIPSGYEFAALIDDLIAVSRSDSGLAPETRAALATLARDVHLQVFVTPTCPYCPGASRLAHAMALESPRVRADVIESMEFPALADRYGVYGVPKIVLNEARSFEGALPEPAFLEQVMAAAAADAAPAARGE